MFQRTWVTPSFPASSSIASLDRQQSMRPSDPWPA
nr:MAG TPA: hypothetical protein [Bacteriophage sp.]